MKFLARLSVVLCLSFFTSFQTQASPFSEKACEEGDCSKQLKTLKQTARYGSPDAQTVLGLMYLTGNHIGKDEKKAFYWYRKAAVQYPKMWAAVHQTGMMYIQGIGTKKNVKKGLSYLKKAAKAGWLKSQFIIGMSYYAGHYESIDYAKAKKWLTEAAIHGHPVAAFYASSLAEYGKGGEQDFELAYKLLALAAKKGHEGAQIRLLEINENENTPENLTPLTISLLEAKKQLEVKIQLEEKALTDLKQLAEQKQSESKLAVSSPNSSASTSIADNSTASPSEYDENKIVITAERLTPEVINFFVENIENQKIYDNHSTGSRLPGRNCKDIIGCKVMGHPEDIRNFLLGN